MRILRAIAYAWGISCASGASANEAFEFSFQHVGVPVPERTAFLSQQGARVQQRPGRHVSVEFNFSASSRESKAQRNFAQIAESRGLAQPLKLGQATLSLGASMAVRFRLKF